MTPKRRRGLYPAECSFAMTALLTSLLLSCTSASLQSDDAPSPQPPNPDVGCQDAPAELLDPRAIRQRTDRCEPPRAFECETRAPRSHEVVRVRLVVSHDRAIVSRTTGVLCGRYDGIYRSTRECRDVPLEDARAVVASFEDPTTIAECRATVDDRAGDDMFSLGGVTSMALRSQTMFCNERLMLFEPCAVFAHDAPRARIANVCGEIFRLVGVRR